MLREVLLTDRDVLDPRNKGLELMILTSLFATNLVGDSSPTSNNTFAGVSISYSFNYNFAGLSCSLSGSLSGS